MATDNIENPDDSLVDVEDRDVKLRKVSVGMCAAFKESLAKILYEDGELGLETELGDTSNSSKSAGRHTSIQQARPIRMVVAMQEVFPAIALVSPMYFVSLYIMSPLPPFPTLQPPPLSRLCIYGSLP